MDVGYKDGINEGKEVGYWDGGFDIDGLSDGASEGLVVQGQRQQVVVQISRAAG